MKIAFMFSGQGSQYLGMGLDFYENFSYVREIFEKAEKITGYQIRDIMFRDEGLLNQTRYTQVAMFTIYQVILTVLKNHGIIADLSMGLSLGEYGAYLHNRVFSFEKGLEIVKKRAALMEDATLLNPGKMCAVVGLEIEEIEELIKQIKGYLTIANHNSYNQYVVSGESDAVDIFLEKAIESKAKIATILKTSGAFHSEMMKNAEIEFLKFLEEQDLKEPELGLYLNLTGDKYNGNLSKSMAMQISNSVKFYQMVENMIDSGVDVFIEIGPKKILANLVKRVNKNVKVMNVEDIKSLNATLHELEDYNGN